MKNDKIISVVHGADYWEVAECDETLLDGLIIPGGKRSQPIWDKYEGKYQINPLNLREFASRVSFYGYTVQIIPDPCYI